MFIDTPPEYGNPAQPESASDLIQETIALWQQRGVALSPEEALCAIKSVKGLFDLLDRWDQEEINNRQKQSVPVVF